MIHDYGRGHGSVDGRGISASPLGMVVECTLSRDMEPVKCRIFYINFIPRSCFGLVCFVNCNHYFQQTFFSTGNGTGFSTGTGTLISTGICFTTAYLNWKS